MCDIVVNGRFRNRPMNGVGRYASEILRQWDGHPVDVISPRRPLRGIGGHLWEQCVLPGRAHGLLWSPANTGPVMVARQVVTIHDLSPFDGPQWFSPVFVLWYRSLLPVLARRSQRVLTGSTFSRDRLLACFKLPPEKVVVASPGVDSSHFHPVDVAPVRALHALPETYLLFVGSLDPRKNLPLLLRAWEILRPKFPNLALVIAGGSAPIFRGGTTSRVAKDAQFLGPVADSELPALYSGAAALVMPSLYEGFGLPVLEAMACGTPVICSTAGALPETVGNAAILFDPGDVGSLAGAIDNVLRDDTLRELLRQKGFERSAASSWRLTAQKIWDVLEQERGRGTPTRHG